MLDQLPPEILCEIAKNFWLYEDFWAISATCTWARAALISGPKPALFSYRSCDDRRKALFIEFKLNGYLMRFRRLFGHWDILWNYLTRRRDMLGMLSGIIKNYRFQISFYRGQKHLFNFLVEGGNRISLTSLYGSSIADDSILIISRRRGEFIYHNKFKLGPEHKLGFEAILDKIRQFDGERLVLQIIRLLRRAACGPQEGGG